MGQADNPGLQPRLCLRLTCPEPTLLPSSSSPVASPNKPCTPESGPRLVSHKPGLTPSVQPRGSKCSVLAEGSPLTICFAVFPQLRVIAYSHLHLSI